MSDSRQESDDELETQNWSKTGAHGRDFLKPAQTGRRSISPLTLLREDLSQFKDEVLKVFTDKDSNSRHRPPPGKSVSTLTLLNKELNQMKEDLSSVFKINLSKERDGKDTSSRDTKPSEDFSKRESDLFRLVQKTKESAAAEEQRKEPGRLLTRQEEEVNTGAERKQQNGSKRGSEQEEEWEVLESPFSETLSPRITLLSLIKSPELDLRDQACEGPWSLKNYACYLTLDPTTANSELRLTDMNRTATRVWLDLPIQEHPERFERCPQVLCREAQLDRVYWEVEWRGGADVGVAYPNICRDGDASSCLLGHNQLSWSLECSEGSYTPCHNKIRFKSSCPRPFSRRVGVFLNHAEGSLSFYCVSQNDMVHLHTFTSTFTEPLYPGFWVWAYDGSVSLRQVEMGWERLLQ